ncbi:MAG: CBO2463/CBO2479 domain-containing protein [Oscillospiraceae bacterium]
MLIRGIHVNNTAVPYTGVITAVSDGEFVVQISSRMGILKLPSRSLICEKQPKVGDKVKFLMSFIELVENDYEREESDTL